MTLRSKIFLAVIASVLATVLFIAAATISVNRLINADRRSSIANEISRAALQLDSLAAEFLVSKSPRVVRQWRGRHDSLANLLTTAPFRDSRLREVVREFEERRVLSARLFELIVTPDDDVGTSSLVRTRREQLIIQNILSTTGGMVALADQLRRINRAVFEETEGPVLWFAAGTVLLVVLVNGGILIGVGPGITTAYRQLRQTVSAIGAGQFDRELPVSKDRELGALYQSIGWMRDSIKESRLRLATVIGTVTDSIVAIDSHGRIQMFNPAAETMFGYTAEEVLGKNVRMLMPSPHREAHDGYLAASRKSTARRIIGQNRELEGIRKDGTTFPIELAVGETELMGERVFVGSIRDIGLRRQHEEQLASLITELTRSNKELEQFAYVASHDLQEPLRMVASFTGLLSEKYGGQLDEQAQGYIAHAVDGAKRMQMLINGLLDYSRVGTRGKEFTSEDCNAIVAEAIENLDVLIDENKAAVSVERLPTISADSEQMVRVFQNLIANAIKFHREGVTPEVSVSAERDKQLWRISVADNGIGIDPEYADRIFNIFQRLHRRGEYPGEGIGLAVVKRIVERHGGKIWMESVPGQGTTFHFTVQPAT